MNKTILLVDDEYSVLKILKTILNHLGFDVISADNPHEGIESAKINNIDLLITDFKMSEMNGFEMSKVISSFKPDLKMILISGYVDECETLPENIKKKFLAKPFSITELKSKIQEVLESGG